MEATVVNEAVNVVETVAETAKIAPKDLGIVGGIFVGGVITGVVATKYVAPAAKKGFGKIRDKFAKKNETAEAEVVEEETSEAK